MRYSKDTARSVESHVRSTIGRLWTAKSRGSRGASASISKLGHAAGKALGEDVDVLGIEFDRMPAGIAGTGDDPSEGESAVHAALCLWGRHQGSNVECMDGGNALGAAARVLAHRKKTVLADGEMSREMRAVIAADDMQDLEQRMRRLVDQLSAVGIPLDYGRLAGQLYKVQYGFMADGVRMQWAREWATWSHGDDDGNEPEDGSGKDVGNA